MVRTGSECSRWEGNRRPRFPTRSPFPTLPRYGGRGTHTSRSAWAVLKRFGEIGVDQPFEYVRNGVRQAQPFSHTLQHVVNHGTYHRGQVVTMLRQLGAEALTTDLIAYYRERQAV